MKIADLMHERLTQALTPQALEVIDQSHEHAGHSGNPDGAGETHYHLVIRAQAFEGLSRIARHRLVHSALGDLVPRIHALSMDLDVAAPL